MDFKRFAISVLLAVGALGANCALAQLQGPQPTAVPQETSSEIEQVTESPAGDLEARPLPLSAAPILRFPSVTEECTPLDRQSPACAKPILIEQGRASWYGPGFQGKQTANGERFDMHGLTAAHRSLPFGTQLRVRSLRNSREVEVRINDRGPFKPGVIIDLSRSAAQALGILGLGVNEVALSIVNPAEAATVMALQKAAAKKRGIAEPQAHVRHGRARQGRGASAHHSAPQKSLHRKKVR